MAQLLAAAPKTPDEGFEDLLDLAKMALPNLKKDPGGEAAQLVQAMREYLRGVKASDREVPVLLAARHALHSARLSGRPSLGGHACKSVVATMLPRLMELCSPLFPECSGVLARYHDNGLFGNVLQVYDLLLLSGPGASVLVDWRRQGSEGHFQYGPEGVDLWAELFQPQDRCRSAHHGAEEVAKSVVMPSRINPVFINQLRGYFWTLPSADLAAVRRGYYAAATQCLRPRASISERVNAVCSEWREGARIVGVHKRLGTPEVAACQLSQRAPSTAEYIALVRALLLQEGGGSDEGRPVVFLATDDLHAVAAFEAAFPEGGSAQLCCRAEVKRSKGGVRADGVDDEVHRSPGEVADAENALIDAFCLARCSDLVCTDSNLSIFVALWSPELRLHPISEILPADWEEAAAKPEEAVHKSYKVVFNPMVFLRSGPTPASELLGARKLGEEVRTTGRAFEGWIEVEEGGWMLVDADRLLNSRGKGDLLEPVGSETW